MHRSRTTEEAREALSSFCKAVGTHGDKRVHIFTVPVDEERDADCILSDVIIERDLLKAALKLITELTWDMEYYETGDSPGATMLRIAKLAVHGLYECTCDKEAEAARPCLFCRISQENRKEKKA